MADVLFRVPHLTDIVGLAAKMREADVAECRAAGHYDVLRVIEDGVARSQWVRAALVDEQIACVFGVAPLGTYTTPVGVPWMLGTDQVLRHPRLFLAWARVVVAEMLALFPVLMNYVHSDNAQAVRWLQHAGFVIQPSEPYGPRAALFHRFEMVRS